MRVLRALLVLAIGMASVDVIAAPASQAASAASLSGTASDGTGRILSNAVVQLRNASSGQLAGTATTNAAGSFSFTGLNPGTYVVEVTNAAGQIVGTSGMVVVGAGAAVTGVGVTASVAKAVATHVGFLGPHTLPIVVGVASAAGVAGAIEAATGGDASPSQ